MTEFRSILHPDREPSVAELLSKINALESADQKLALRGGSAVTYDVNGFIETLNVGSLSANVILVGGGAADVNSGVTKIEGGKIVTGSVTATQLASSYIVVGDAASDVNSGAVTITPGKVLINGATTLDDWSHATNATYIDGGMIYTNTITADEIAANTITGTQLTTSRIDTVTQAISGGLYIGGHASPAYDLVVVDDAAIGGIVRTDDIDDNGQGFVEIRDDIYINGNMTVASWQSFNGDMDMENHDINDVKTLNATTKNFLIPHPDGSKRLLKYTAVEAPEVAVYYRGIVKLTSTQEFVPVPKHFEQVTEPTGLVTVQITPVSSSPVHIVERPTHKGFTVGGAIGTEVMFEIKAVRKGYLDNAVEIDLENPTSEFGIEYVSKKEERDEIKAELKAKRISKAEKRALTAEEDARKLAVHTKQKAELEKAKETDLTN